MTPQPQPGLLRRSRPGALLCVLLGAALLLGADADRAAAQLPLSEAEERFEEARAEYDRRLSLYQQSFFQSERALEGVRRALELRDGSQEEQARAAFHARAVEQMDAEADVRRAAERLRVASRDLIVALEAREAEILDELSPAILAPATTAALEAEWIRVRQRTLEVDRIGGGIEEDLDLRPVLQLSADPRDTPADLRGKAGVLEDQAETYDEIVRRVDELILELERRVQQDRARQDALDGIQRFDPDLIPGGRLGRVPPGTRDDGLPAGLEGGLALLPLTEQVELFRGIRMQAMEYRDLAIEQARVFRELAEGTGG
jgi:hypothetical protein